PGTDFIAAPASASASFSASVIPLDTLIFQDAEAAQHYLLPPPTAKTKSCLNCPLLLRARDQTKLSQLPAATQARIEQRGQLLLVPKLTGSLAPEQAPATRLEILASHWPAPTTAARQLPHRVGALRPPGHDGQRHLFSRCQRQRQRRGPATGAGRPLRPPQKPARLLGCVFALRG
nr:hypothetical protein [Tanacetum cinerariifolium]